MEAKDTVMNDQQVLDFYYTNRKKDISEKGLLEAQAEISFKAGREEERKFILQNTDRDKRARLEGIREVVEFIGEPFEHNIKANPFAGLRIHDVEDCFACKYEVQLKVWGIE